MTATSPARRQGHPRIQKNRRPFSGQASLPLKHVVAVPTMIAATSIAFIQPAAAASTHVVKKGDTLSEIALANGLSLSQLLELNDLKAKDIIIPGQIIAVKDDLKAQPAPKNSAKKFVKDSAPLQVWKVWDAKGRSHYIQATGRQTNVYVTTFLSSGSRVQARVAAGISVQAANIPAPTPAKTTPAKPTLAPKSPAQKKPLPGKPSAPAAQARVFVKDTAPFQTWKIWDAKGKSHFFEGTGKQANTYLNVFMSTGDKNAARTAAAKLGPLSRPAMPATKAPSLKAPQRPAAPTISAKRWVDSKAAFQRWKVTSPGGSSHFFDGTGAQANAYINTFFATGSKDAARAAALKLGPLTPPAPPRPTAPAVNRPAPPVLTPNVPVGNVPSIVAQVARTWGVDPALALAFAEQESGFQPGVVSSAGALGVMQVMPANQGWLSSLAGRPLNLNNTVDNITAGVVMIKYLVNSSPSRDIAIASYYQGQGGVSQYGMLPETRRYVASVNARYARFAG